MRTRPIGQTRDSQTGCERDRNRTGPTPSNTASCMNSPTGRSMTPSSGATSSRLRVCVDAHRRVRLRGRSSADYGRQGLVDRLPRDVDRRRTTTSSVRLTHWECPLTSGTDPVPADATEAFEDLLTRAALEGEYEETLAVLVPAEWIYLTWATAASGVPEEFYLREWIELHDTSNSRRSSRGCEANSTSTDRSSASADSIASETLLPNRGSRNRVLRDGLRLISSRAESRARL